MTWDEWGGCSEYGGGGGPRGNDGGGGGRRRGRGAVLAGSGRGGHGGRRGRQPGAAGHGPAVSALVAAVRLEAAVSGAEQKPQRSPMSWMPHHVHTSRRTEETSW